MSTPTLAIALHGASGRMGMRIAALASLDPSIRIVAQFHRENPWNSANDPGGRDGEGVEVVIDFSNASATTSAIDLALTHRAALVVGTTGLGETVVSSLEEASKKIPVMIAPNTSPGVAVMRFLAREAGRLMPESEVDIVEMHHAAKLDRPSGTALALAAALAEARRTIPNERIHAVRAGDIVGEHTVQFASQGEVIRLVHTATTRDLFASGALRAARWLRGRSPGMYTIEQSLGLAR